MLPAWRGLRVILHAALVLTVVARTRIHNNAGIERLRELYPNHDWSTHVQEWKPAPVHEFNFVTKDEDQHKLYSENLGQDISMWRHRAPLRTGDLVSYFQSFRVRRRSRRLIAIVKGQVYTVMLPSPGRGSIPQISSTCIKPCDYLLAAAVESLKNWTRTVAFPDVLFALNLGDASICKGSLQGAAKAPDGPCPVPIFSFQKEWDVRRDEDILVPITKDINQSLYDFDWKKKIDRAIFRGADWCHSKTYPYASTVCSRTYLSRMSLIPEFAKDIDVGFVSSFTSSPWDLKTTTSLCTGEELFLPLAVPGRGFVPVPDLARFKFLLHLDGITASTRLAKVLHTNSVVLKQKSPWIEWYYRSLLEGTHYLSFWLTDKNDVFQVIGNVRNKTHYLQDVAHNAQKFIYAYGSPTARMLYWRRALTEYKRLFPDMDSYIATLPA